MKLITQQIGHNIGFKISKTEISFFFGVSLKPYHCKQDASMHPQMCYSHWRFFHITQQRLLFFCFSPNVQIQLISWFPWQFFENCSIRIWFSDQKLSFFGLPKCLNDNKQLRFPLILWNTAQIQFHIVV